MNFTYRRFAILSLLMVTSAQADGFVGRDLLDSVQTLGDQYSHCPRSWQHGDCREEVQNWVDFDRDLYRDYMECRHLRRNERREGRYRCEKRGEGRFTIHGRLRYRGMVPMPFRYDVVKQGNGWVVEIRIHFKDKNLSQSELRSIDENLANAAEFWSKYAPIPGMSFKFVRVENRKNAHFVLGMKRSDSSPVLYNQRWNTGMKELREPDETGMHHHSYAHEIGHMMGLDDEYNHLRALTSPGYDFWKDGATADCDAESLMCRDQVKYRINPNHPKNYHYYMILKRLDACENDR